MMQHPTPLSARPAGGRIAALAAALLVLPLTGLAQEPANLDIYWIDVEGGAATLVVTPARESILMDTGWPRADARDALRIQAAMNDAGIDRIDYLLFSHFHTDHVGGLSALAERVPIGQMVDHGDSVELGSARGQALWDEYIGFAADRRRSVAPGDKLPLERLELTFVASHRELVDSLEPQMPNTLCEGVAPPAPDMGENGHSLGYLLSLGAFQFLNLGDLTPDREHALACPENRLGVVDLWQVPHHGGYGAIRPELAGCSAHGGGRQQRSPQGGDAGFAGRDPGHGGGRRRLAVAPDTDRRRRPQHRRGAHRQPDGGGRLRGALDQGDGGARRPKLVDDQRPDRLQPDLSVPVAARDPGGNRERASRIVSTSTRHGPGSLIWNAGARR